MGRRKKTLTICRPVYFPLFLRAWQVSAKQIIENNQVKACKNVQVLAWGGGVIKVRCVCDGWALHVCCVHTGNYWSMKRGGIHLWCTACSRAKTSKKARKGWKRTAGGKKKKNGIMVKTGMQLEIPELISITSFLEKHSTESFAWHLISMYLYINTYWNMLVCTLGCSWSI